MTDPSTRTGVEGEDGSVEKVVSPYAAVALLEAEMALAQGDEKSAIQSLTMALTSEPDDPLLQVRLAAAYLAHGDTARAQEICSEVLAKDPGYDMALLMMGDIALSEGRLEDAEASYLTVLEHEPTSFEAHERLIHLYREAGDPSSALEMTVLLIQSDPTHDDAFLTAAELSMELNLTDDAFTFMAKHIEQLPLLETTGDRYGSILTLASRLLEKGETDQALFLYSTVLSVRPDDIQGLLGLARALLARGDTCAARKALADMDAPDAQTPASRVVEVADLWLQAARPGRTLSILEARFGEPSPTTPPSARALWIRALAADLRFEEGSTFLGTFASDEREFLLEARGALAAAMVEAGLAQDGWALLASKTGDIPDLLGQKVVRKALLGALLEGIDPQMQEQIRLACTTSPQGRIVLLEESFLGSFSPDAVALVDGLDEIEGEQPADDVLVDAMVLRATCLIEGVCKDNPTAILSLTARIAELAPADPRLPGLRGMFYLATGNVERALLSLEKADRIAPADPMTKLWLARVVAEAGEQPRAIGLLEAALALDPPSHVLSAVLEQLM